MNRNGYSKAVGLAVGCGTLAGLVAGCGSTHHEATEQNTVTPAASPSPAEHKVGDTVTVAAGDMKYGVTLLSVVEPAQPANEYSAAQAGHHLAATEFRVTAETSVDENSNNSATVIGSNEQQYSSALAQLAAGTNFANGSVRLQPGTSLIGWVPFEVPSGVRVAKVRWSPASGFSGKPAEWTVNTTSAETPAASPTASPTAAAPTSGPTAAPAGDPTDTVIAYFDAINSGNYRKAWNLGGKNTTSSYSSFVDGFKTTASVSVDILNLSGDIGTGVVTARITTLETDGSTKVFEGDYTVRDNVITEFKVRQVS